MRLVGTRTGVTRPPFGLIKSAILLKRTGLTPDTLSSFGPTAPTSGRGALRTHPRLRRFEVLNFRYFVSIWFEAFIRSSNRLAASSPRASKAAMPPSAKWVTASSSPGSRSASLLDVGIEREIGPACRLREQPKGAFRRTRAALLE